MLEDYLIALKEAIKKGDSKKQRKIIADLNRLGMDAGTAYIIVNEIGG